MGNPETQATFGTIHKKKTNTTRNTTQKINKTRNTVVYPEPRYSPSLRVSNCCI